MGSLNTLVAKNAWAFINSAASRLTSSVGEGVDKVLARLSEQDLSKSELIQLYATQGLPSGWPGAEDLSVSVSKA